MRRHAIRKLFRHLFKTAWWKPNKQSRKQIKEEADKLIGWDKESNPAWAKTWKYFIKRQHPWYGLIELNQFKIFEMRDYMKNHSSICEEETEKQIKEMTEVSELGDKILTDEYEKSAHKWLRDNTVPVTIVSKVVKGDTLKERLSCKNEIARLYNTNMFDELMNKLDLENNYCTSLEVETNLKNYLKDKDTRKLDQWLSDNNLSRKDVLLSFTSEWINGNSEEENQEYFRSLLTEAWQDRQNDINKYFECIAEGVDHWGD